MVRGRIVNADLQSTLFKPILTNTIEADPNIRSLLFEQYKLYVEMADRISERRQNANTYALSINSALIAVMGYLQAPIAYPSTTPQPALLWAISVAGIILNYVWYRMIRSYSDLNSAKFKVVHAIESKLTCCPYDAEWVAVGRGKASNLYLPFTHIEKYIPWVFLSLHAVVLLILLWPDIKTVALLSSGA